VPFSYTTYSYVDYCIIGGYFVDIFVMRRDKVVYLYSCELICKIFYIKYFYRIHWLLYELQLACGALTTA